MAIVPVLYGNVLLLQASFWDMAIPKKPIPIAVDLILLGFSILSFTIIFSKLGLFGRVKRANAGFLRVFRKATRLDAVASASEQFKDASLATVYDFGYAEVCRQVAAHRGLNNLIALERSLQLGVSDEIARLEHNMNWLATAAAVCPFIGLLGTVVGIITAFQDLGMSGATNIRAVGPGIADALFATALGLFAAIPAAIAYNYFNNAIKETGQRMEDFTLEFLNLTERNFEGQ